MEEWKVMELKLEENLRKLSQGFVDTNDTEIEQVGSCVMISIALCKDCAALDDYVARKDLWDTIKPDMEETIKEIEEFITEKSL